MKISILTVCPENFESFLKFHSIERAVKLGLLEIEVLDVRDYVKGSFRAVDDSPYGGGRGMVLRCEPVMRAVASIRTETSHIVAVTPAGVRYDQKKAHELSERDHLILLCGHYEGFDERIFSVVDEEISMGDYILSGGELPAMTIADSIARLLPGNLKEGSAEEESFENGMLEYPQYTRPIEYEGMKVPEVLLSGNHEAIRKWRMEQSLKRTKERRPDLLE